MDRAIDLQNINDLSLSFLSSSIACEYTVKWNKPRTRGLIDGSSIQFLVIGTKNIENDWIGIGFNRRNKEMKGTDIILGYFDNAGTGVIKDFYAKRYGSVEEDEIQDIFDTRIERKDGITMLEFKRKIVSSNEVSFLVHAGSLCLYEDY